MTFKTIKKREMLVSKNIEGVPRIIDILAKLWYLFTFYS